MYHTEAELEPYAIEAIKANNGYITTDRLKEYIKSKVDLLPGDNETIASRSKATNETELKSEAEAMMI